jgi:glycerate kinase
MILIAPYTFKGTMTSSEAADVIAGMIRRLTPHAHLLQLPLGDGGTGTLDALVGGIGGEIRVDRCTQATGTTGKCRWGLLSDGRCVIEAAECIALARVPHDRRSPHRLVTHGLGELVLKALESDVTSMLIGLGDTATHDCGLGMASALGFRFLDRYGNPLSPAGTSLIELDTIDTRQVYQRLPSVHVTALCDVMNMLTGSDGAAMRFARQKGADTRTVELLEEGGHRFARVVERDLGVSVSELPGAGAAGGLGAGLAAFLGADLVSGAEAVLNAVGFEDRLRQCSMVVTGEGRVDGKTLLGKGVAMVARRAAQAGVGCIIVAGGIEGDQQALEEQLNASIVLLDQLSEVDRSQTGRDEMLSLLGL